MTFPVLTAALEALRSTAAAVTAEQLDDPTPCADWTVAQVLLHAAGDQHAWAAAVASAEPPAYNPFQPPARPDGTVGELIAAAVGAATGAWAGVDPDGAVPTPLPPFPTMPALLAATACALDAAVHAWDIAVATGQPSPLNAELADQLQPAADATADTLRGFAYAAALPGSSGDGAAARLLRFLGRDPSWSR